MKYFLLTIKHKWFVFLAGIKLGVPIWRLMKHDLSKFSMKELPHYNRQFFGKANQPEKFIKAWIHHQNKNDHHWEYWIPRTGHNRCIPSYPDNQPVDIPRNAILEMIADWFGALRTYEKKWPVENWPWFDKNFEKMIITESTRKFILETLEKYFSKLHNKEK